MLTIHAISGRTLTLGREGENLARQVIFDISEWRASYGDGTVSLIVQRHGDAEPYPCTVTVDGSSVTWKVMATDTARKGYGKCELRYTVGDVLVKSETWNTYTADALGTPAPEPPEPAKNWVDTVLKSSSDAKQAATESAESARQSAESSVNAANSANEAQKSREAIENMEVAAVSLSPDSAATVEKAIADGKVKLTFGIPKGEKGESDIFWLNTVSDSRIAETFDEIVAAYKAGKSIWIRDTHSFGDIVATVQAYLVRPIEDDAGTNILGMFIICGGSAYGFSEIGAADALMNGTYYIYASPEEVTFIPIASVVAELGIGYSPRESKLYESAGDSTSASPVDHVHPAPFPDWTNNIGKALFVNDANETPSQAFEWRDVPNGEFTSKVGDFLRVTEVDSNNKPTKWATDSIGGSKEPMIVTFTITGFSPFKLKADTLYDDIREAANAGRIIYAFVPEPVGPMFGQLSMIENNNILFNAINYTGQIINITMRSDSNIIGMAYDLLYRPDDAVGGGDFDAYNHRIKGVKEPTDPSDVATKDYVDKSLGSSDISLGLTAATVGQTVVVKSVDESGKPTEWEAADMAADGKDGAPGKDNLPNVETLAGTEQSIELAYNVEYRCADALTALTITGFGAPTESGKAALYSIMFTAAESGVTVTLPDTIVWAVAEPVFTAGYAYWITWTELGDKYLAVWVEVPANG